MRTDVFRVGSLGAFLICGLILVMALSAVRAQRQSTDATRANLLAFNNDMANRVDVYRYLAKNYSAFAQLMSEPANSAKRKLAWANRLESAQTELSIPSMSFEISPFTVVSGASKQLTIGYEEIDLDLGMLHDTQLLKFFSYLDNNSPDVFEVTRVNVERLEKTDSTKENRLINLQIRFTLRWYTYYAGEERADAI